MTGKNRGSANTGRLVAGAALVLAGAGAGLAATLATGAWWARGLGGAVGGLAGLAAALWVDHAHQLRDARDVRDEILDPVVSEAGQDDSVFALLVATCAIAPFRGRAAELAQLDRWCDDPRAHPVLVITGPAGVGKTRLVTEFASRRPDLVPGWLHRESGAQAVTAVRACHDPAVILVDDADERPDLNSLLEDLAAGPDGSPMRVVLISRAADPRAQIRSRLEDRYRWILGDQTPVLSVGTFGNQDDQVRWFREAVRAYAAARRTPPPDLPGILSRGITAVAEEPILALQAQALLAVLNCEAGRPWRAGAGMAPFEEIARALFAHEQARWHQVVARPEWGLTDLTPAIQERAVAALVISGAADESQAVAALRRVADLADARTERLANIGRWAGHLYPHEPPWPIRIQPDMLAEWFAVTQLTTHPELAEMYGGMDPEHSAVLLMLLAHASDHIPQAARLFADLIAGDIIGLARPAIVAARTATKGQRLLDTAIASLITQANWTPDSLNALNSELPHGLLPRTHAAITAALVASARGSGVSEHLASMLRHLGLHLRDLGCPQEAVAATEEALALYRELAAANPAHQPELAATLTSLGLHLSNLGRPQEALAATEEALGLWRELAAANPAHQPGLAGTLQHVGIDLRDLGCPQEAVAATEEALGLWRELAAAHPAHQPDLAATLQTLGAYLRLLGRPQEALAATEEVLALYRELAAANPAHQPGLAATLQNLGTGLRDLGRPQEALAAIEEALDLWRELAAAHPAHQPDLAMTLQTLGIHLRDLGRHQEALAATEEALALYRRKLAAANPAHQPDLARTVHSLGVHLRDLGRHQEALAATEEALGLYRKLAAANPAHQPELAATLQNLGIDLRDLGRPQEALAATEEALDLCRELAAANPAHQPELARTLKNLGIHLRDLGRPQEALAARKEAVEIYRALAGANPDLYDQTYQRALAGLKRDLAREGQHGALAGLHLSGQRVTDGRPHDVPPSPETPPSPATGVP